MGKEKSIVTPYKKDFNRIKEHHSSIYFGASLMAIYELAKQKNYSLVGTNINGSNAFCVHNDILKNSNIKSLSPEQCFHKNSFNLLVIIKKIKMVPLLMKQLTSVLLKY